MPAPSRRGSGVNTLDWMFPAADPARPDGYGDLMDIDRRLVALNEQAAADRATMDAPRSEPHTLLAMAQHRLRMQRRATERRRLGRLNQAAFAFMAEMGLVA